MKSITRAQVREIDRRATDEYGVPSLVLMENAGRGAAELLMRLNPDRQPTTVVCGPGNNGGDGFVMARHLHLSGWRVQVFCESPATPDAEAAFRLAMKMRLMEDYYDEFFPGWIIDALFGTGLSRPISEHGAHMINRMNNAGLPILSMDIPSGLDCDTGEPLGVCVRATHTATFVAPKKGFDNPASTIYTGEVHVVDIGAPRVLVDQYIK